jgi:hypothetical protein
MTARLVAIVAVSARCRGELVFLRFGWGGLSLGDTR